LSFAGILGCGRRSFSGDLIHLGEHNVLKGVTFAFEVGEETDEVGKLGDFAVKNIGHALPRLSEFFQFARNSLVQAQGDIDPFYLALLGAFCAHPKTPVLAAFGLRV